MVPHQPPPKRPNGPDRRVWLAVIGVIANLIRLIIDVARH